jgi:hypothetical protein
MYRVPPRGPFRRLLQLIVNGVDHCVALYSAGLPAIDPGISRTSIRGIQWPAVCPRARYPALKASSRTCRSGTYPASSRHGWSKPVQSVMNGACSWVTHARSGHIQGAGPLPPAAATGALARQAQVVKTRCPAPRGIA